MKTSSGHLTYCTNIHSGEGWEDHFKAIKQNFPGIKEKLSPAAPMGIGLRLSNKASIELHKKQNLQVFQQWLAESNAYVFTMNGFPYGAFHQSSVKDQVHAPDWTTDDRLQYTTRLFDILADLLPEGMDGGVSTSPLSYKYWFKWPEEAVSAQKAATLNILKLTQHLIHISKTTGKILHLDIEPEPDGMLENGQEFLEWYENSLLPAGMQIFSGLYGITPDEAAALIKTHVRLCYDVCHFAVSYESHADMLRLLQEKGILVGKIQISAALKAVMEGDVTTRQEKTSAFATFNEPVYLHQVVARTTGSNLLRYRDLPEALLDAGNPAVSEWRAHFHVPVFEKNFGVLQSTQDDIVELLQWHKLNPITPHLEVETYTWEVLSEDLKLPIQQSITRELEWVLGKL